MVLWDFSIFIRLVIAQLLEDGLGHVGVEVVYEYSLRHLNYNSN